MPMNARGRCIAVAASTGARCGNPAQHGERCWIHLGKAVADVREPVYRCRSYGPGHDVHWIQARKAAECEADKRTGLLMHVDETELEVWFGDTTEVYRNHHARTLDANIAKRGAWVEVQTRWSLLRMGRRLISIASDCSTWTPCP